jgi:integration host factor subunit beta
MTKSELIEKLSSEADLPLKKTARLVTLVFDELSEALAKGERIEIRGFGSFKIKHYKAYTGRNPKTSEAFQVEPKNLPFFKCGLELKKKLNPQNL